MLDRYVLDAPSDQIAVDLFEGSWSTRFPASTGIVAGTVPLFEDDRIIWAIEQAGGVDGKRVLELGPLEAGHTTMLHNAGATVVAVEGNSQAYLKCLIVKELMQLTRARFLLGDFGRYLETTDERFDLVLASGVLYHSPNPIELLESIADKADRIAIWTHYFDQAIIDKHHARRFVPTPEMHSWRGRSHPLHRRNYLESLNWAGFCGGTETSALWMERDSLLAVLAELGFSDVAVMKDDQDHPHGPCIMLYAQR